MKQNELDINTYGAFLDENVAIPPIKKGVLDEKIFSVKDVFAVENHTNSAGNPDWLRTHQHAKETAPVLKKLLSAGAMLKGMTVTDEMMYSLHGENIHYGTPVNPVTPERIPGGSSSGSAVSVSAKIRDFAIGTDTGGSVRIPAAYCGIFGFRPTHHAIPIDGVIPLAESLDTVGWFARNASLLEKIGNVLLPPCSEPKKFRRIVIGSDAFSLLPRRLEEELIPMVQNCCDKVDHHERHPITENLREWVDVFRVIQGFEIWKNHGEWVTNTNPQFGPGIKERFDMAKSISNEDVKIAKTKRLMIQDEMNDILRDDTLLIIPTTAGETPKIGLDPSEVDVIRQRTMQLTCIAGLNGLPQVTIPIQRSGNLPPLSLSIIAPRSRDRELLQFVSSLHC